MDRGSTDRPEPRGAFAPPQDPKPPIGVTPGNPPVEAVTLSRLDLLRRLVQATDRFLCGPNCRGVDMDLAMRRTADWYSVEGVALARLLREAEDACAEWQREIDEVTP